MQAKKSVSKMRKILVAEDNETNRILLKRLFEGNGHEVAFVQNGVEAVTACCTTIFDFILMDCRMPKMDGYQASQIIRSDRKSYNQDTLIYAFTSDELSDIKAKCRNAQMNGLVSKPPDLERLLATLSRIPNRRRRLNLSLLEKLSVLNQVGLSHLQSELIESFLQHLPQRLGEIETAIESESFKQSTAHAHALRGAAGTVGALKIAILCRRIEMAAKAGLTLESKKLFLCLVLAIGQTTPLLGAYLANHLLE